MFHAPIIEIRIKDAKGQILKDLDFRFEFDDESKAPKVEVTQDETHGYNYISLTPFYTGKCRLHVTTADKQSKSFPLEIGGEGVGAEFYMFSGKEKTLKIAGLEIPIIERKSKMVVRFDETITERNRKKVQRLIQPLVEQEDDKSILLDKSKTKLQALKKSKEKVSTIKELKVELEKIRGVELEEEAIELPDGEMIRLSKFLTATLNTDTNRIKLYAEIKKMGGSVIQSSHSDTNEISVYFENATQGKLQQVIEKLDQHQDIETVVPEFEGEDEDFAPVFPNDLLRPQQYYLNTVRLPEAWDLISGVHADKKFGSADLILAIHDAGIQTGPMHTDFTGSVTGGTLSGVIGNTNKVYYLYKTNQPNVPVAGNLMAPGNGAAPGNHGSKVTGVAAGLSDGNNGVVGYAANARVLSINRNGSRNNNLRMHAFLFMSGFEPGWTPGGGLYHATQTFPVPFKRAGNPGPGAGVINCSHAFGGGALSAGLQRAFRNITHLGRNRRGIVIVTASGNGNRDTRSGSIWGNEVNVIKVGGSAINHLGQENLMPKSSFGTGTSFLIDLCAPSESVIQDLHNPPTSYGVVTATNIGTGNAIGTTVTQRAITNAPNAGDTDVKLLVAHMAQFPIGTRVVIQDPANREHTEVRRVLATPNATTLRLDLPLQFGYSIGDNLITGARDWTTTFGGTSAAAPQVSGLAALLISAKPVLTWLEVREIMRTTAVKINPRLTGFNRSQEWVELSAAGVATRVVTAEGLLDVAVGAHRTTANVQLNKGSRSISVADNSGFSENQIILIGAESKLDGVAATAQRKLDIDRADEFEIGDTVIIGKQSQTFLEAPAVAATTRIQVQSVDGFAVGDELQVGTEFVRITSIAYTAGNAGNRGRTRINFAFIGPGAAFVQQPVGTIVQIRSTQKEGPFTIVGKAGNELEFATDINVAHPDNRIIQKVGTETTVVRKVDANGNDLTVDALTKTHLLNNAPNIIHIVGGKRADYSYGFGFGRIDAANAVQAAIDYDHTERDVMIRNHLTDDGETNLTLKPTHSPDLWVTHNAATAAIPNYGDAGPHEDPRSSVTPPIFQGAGNNDLTVEGAYSGVGKAVYTLEITTAAAQDKFKWSKDGGAQSAEINCIAGSQLLDAGIGVQFGAITGHTLGDKWIVSVENIANRFIHLRIKNRGTKQMFAKSRAGGALPVNMYRMYLCLTDGLPVRRFFGLGLNDMTVESEYTGATADFFTVRIGNTAGAKDKWAWSKGAANLSAWADIPAGNVALSNGVQIKFNADTGHTTGNTWMIYAHPVGSKWMNINHYIEENPAAPFTLTGNTAGTFLLDEKELPRLNGGQNQFFNAPWPEVNRPPVNGPAVNQPAKPLRTFILGEVLPHDGKLSGDTPETNNNYSYRELLFANFGFKDATGLKNIDSFFEVDSFGTVENKDIKIQVGTSVGTFKTESVKMTISMEFDNGTSEEKVFEYTGGSWQFVGGDPAWMSLTRPKLQGSATDAVNEQFNIEFSGTFNVNRLHSRVSIKIEVFSTINTTQVLASKTYQIPVYEQAQLPSARFTGVSPADLAPRSHFFTEASNLTQVVANSYGPEDGSAASRKGKFHVTSLFTAPSDPKAFAVVDGIVMLQRDPTNNDTVNLIVKPFRQAMLGYTPVKYFVYRGIRLDSYLKGSSAADEKLMRLQAGASTFVDELWNQHIAQNGAATPFESKALGYDPVTQNGADLIDSIFFREDPNLQLPHVRRGMHIGEFHADGGSYKFGFEIILEEGTFQPDLAFARKQEHIVDVSAMPNGNKTQKTAKKLKREEILNFIDPAAFFGMHRSKDGYINLSDNSGTTVKLEDEQIYDEIISKFYTKNTLYIDIRNENGVSMDFHGAYAAGAGKAMEVGDAAGSLSATNYEIDEWPILIRTNAGSANANDFNEVHMQFRYRHNVKPILYIEHGRPINPVTKGRFIADTELIPTPAGNKTNTVGFRFPNKDLGAGNRASSAWLLKLHYGVRDGNAITWPDEVPPTEKYTDNLFGPVDINILWTGNHKFSWLAAQDKKYIDADGNGFEHVVDRGVAINNTSAPGTGRVLFYAAAKDSFFNSNNAFIPYNGMTGGVSKRGTFFSEALLFSGYILELDVLEEGGTNIQTLKLNTEPGATGKPVEGMMLLGLHKTQYDTLKAIAGFNNSYPRNCHLQELPGNPLTDVNGVSYSKFKVGLRGIEDNGDALTKFPAADIVVYTVDDLFFFSDAFSSDEPLPTTYTRNYEEQIGALKRPPSHYVVGQVNQATKTFKITGKDLRYEIVRDDKIVIKNSSGNNATYTVSGVNFVGGDSEVVVTGAIPSNAAPLGQLHEVEKPWEDFFIAKDLLGPLTGTPSMPTLVEDFISQIGAIANNPAAKAALQAKADTFAPQILARGRKLCNDNTYAYADDRILYWARIKMIVALKSHPYLMQSLGERKKMIIRFESKSRGYETINFAGALGAKKILISGFDPFFLNPTNPGHNTYQSNPSGAAALALHGQTLAGAPNAFIQSAIFPVRYRDFVKDGGEGVVENLFTKFINPLAAGYADVDMIITISQGGLFEFWVDRFASRFRGGTIDNENKPSPAGNANFKFPVNVIGDQFYETTLPFDKIVPASNAGKKYPIFYNNVFEYEYTDTGVVKRSEYRDANSADGIKNIEDPTHPDHGNLTGLVPSALTAATMPKKNDEEARRGSGGRYLSNEIYYRVARIRAQYNPGLPTGHYHVPKIQSKNTVNRHGGTTTVEFNDVNTKDLIADIATAILNGVKP